MVNRQAPDLMQPTVLEAVFDRDPRDVLPQPLEGDTTAWTDRALEFFACFPRGDFEAARSMMAPATAENLTVDRLQPAWSALASRCGQLEPAAVDGVVSERGTVVVTIVAQGENAALTLRCMQDADQQIVGVTVA
jgi:hypothetical protein